MREGTGVFPTFAIIGSVRDFDVAAKDDYARPIIVRADFISFNANKRIFAHPDNLLAESGEAVEALAFVDEVHGNDVGTIIGRAREAAEAEAGEEFAAFSAAELGDEHETG